MNGILLEKNELIANSLNTINNYSINYEKSSDVYSFSDYCDLVEVDMTRNVFIRGKPAVVEFSVTYDCFHAFMMDQKYENKYGEQIHHYRKFFPYYVFIRVPGDLISLENNAFIDWEREKEIMNMNKTFPFKQDFIDIIEYLSGDNLFKKETEWMVNIYEDFFRITYGL